MNWSAAHAGCKVFLALHSSFPHQTSGYAVRSHSIATHLAAHGVDLAVWTRPGFPWFGKNGVTREQIMRDTVDGIVYHRLPHGAPEQGAGGDRYRSMARDLLRDAVAASGAKIVHAASDLENGWPAVMAGKDQGCRTIYEYRGMWHYTRASRVPWFPASEEYAERHAMELETGREADAVFAISEALREDLAAQGLERDKITVLPNAVDTNRFAPLAPDMALKEELGLAGRRIVGFIGSVTAYEGLDRLMDAVLELNAGGEKIGLLLVGDGAYVNYLRECHAARGSHPAIVFTGRVPFEEVNRYYSITDIMAFPRINARVCQCVPPLKPLEAMAMGKPVIVSDVAALAEMVTHEQTGLICRADDTASLAEQLGRLVSSRQLYRNVAANALEWVRRERSWPRVSQEILKVYEQLVS